MGTAPFVSVENDGEEQPYFTVMAMGLNMPRT